MVGGRFRSCADHAPTERLWIERLEEPVAARQPVGFGVVEELVAVDRLVRLRERDVGDAQRERGQRDQQQDAPEPPIVVTPGHGRRA
jgi:hypothetical protein